MADTKDGQHAANSALSAAKVGLCISHCVDNIGIPFLIMEKNFISVVLERLKLCAVLACIRTWGLVLEPNTCIFQKKKTCKATKNV